MQARPTQTSADALSGLASLLRVRPELQDLCWFSRSWASPHEPDTGGWAPFHIVTRGTCVIDREGTAPTILHGGDIVVLPHGDAHVVRSLSTEPAVRKVSRREHGPIRLRTNADGEAETELICGRLRFEQEPASFLLAMLPSFIVLHADAVTAPRMQAMVFVIRDELVQARAGAGAIAIDLASALLVMVLRAHLEEQASGNGVLTLLTQPATARVVSALVGDPARDWTLDAMAEHAHVSRTTLVRAFRHAADTAPLAFLAELRLGLARHRLATSTVPLGRVAAEVGYESESAFSRAFQRRYGERPGAARRIEHADEGQREGAS